jgi:hypothetical protein
MVQLAKAMTDDFIKCATDMNMSQAEANAWTAAAIIPPARLLRLAEP